MLQIGHNSLWINAEKRQILTVAFCFVFLCKQIFSKIDYEVQIRKWETTTIKVKRLQVLAIKAISNIKPGYKKNIFTSKADSKTHPSVIAVRYHKSTSGDQKSLKALRQKTWNQLPSNMNSEHYKDVLMFEGYFNFIIYYHYCYYFHSCYLNFILYFYAELFRFTRFVTLNFSKFWIKIS